MQQSLRAALFRLALMGTALALEFTPARSSGDLVNPHKGWMLWGTTFGIDGGVDNFRGARMPGRPPNWNHPAFATQSVQLIQALAARYDGDPRITGLKYFFAKCE